MRVLGGARTRFCSASSCCEGMGARRLTLAFPREIEIRRQPSPWRSGSQRNSRSPYAPGENNREGKWIPWEEAQRRKQLAAETKSALFKSPISERLVEEELGQAARELDEAVNRIPQTNSVSKLEVGSRDQPWWLPGWFWIPKGHTLEVAVEGHKATMGEIQKFGHTAKSIRPATTRRIFLCQHKVYICDVLRQRTCNIIDHLRP
ncbi:hypothetical protein BS78_07G212300 [Paspalum vaginatum]|nr:hypothetical protein BS78_07G212300 [Paspalum vaginatum]KAJ1269446.1 hypothetical protein BS78_07G212300 [Paspalum vaginatum]